MPRNSRYVNDAQLITIGRRFNCDEVAEEANGALGRWRRDLKVLGTYRTPGLGSIGPRRCWACWRP